MEEYAPKVCILFRKKNQCSNNRALGPVSHSVTAGAATYFSSMNAKYKHVFFDLDETLWDFKRNSLEAIHEVLDQHRWHERGIEKDAFINRYNYHNELYWDLFRKGKIARTGLRTARWKTTLEEFNIHDEELVQSISESYLKILPTKKSLHNDALDILDYLKLIYSLHIITNGFEEIQLQKIITSGIAGYFTHIITSERAGSQKPNREIFLYAFDLTGASANNSIFIGDSIEADINGAKAIGMDHVLFNSENLPHNENIKIEISHLNDLKNIL